MDDTALLAAFRQHLTQTTIAAVCRETGLNRNTVRELRDGTHGMNSHTRWKLARWVQRQTPRCLSPQQQYLVDVEAECHRACQLFPPFHSAHEAYAVILEELEEFWDEVRQKAAQRSPEAMRAELVQVAAMCLRTVIDLGLEGEQDAAHV